MISKIYYELETFYNFYDKKIGLYNRSFTKDANGKKISWHNYLSGNILTSYQEYYDWIIENKQYSFLFDYEKSHCFQFFYQFKDNKLYKASLSFLPNPEFISQDNYVRFDCDMDSHRDFIHTSYHAHFAYETALRVSINNFPTPQEFMSFILLYHFSDIKLIEEIQKKIQNRRGKSGNIIMNLDELNHKYYQVLKI